MRQVLAPGRLGFADWAIVVVGRETRLPLPLRLGSKQRYGPSPFSVDSRRLMSENYECRMYCVRLRTEARREVAMPTYFFDLIKGNELVEDDQGEDFADIEAAKLEGLASARELLADAAKKGILATSPVYLIRNAAGDILATVPFKDALKPD
jgi:hypothetical protein